MPVPEELTPVPLAPRMIRGLINLRGQILTAIDLRECFQLPPRGDSSREVNLVVRNNDEGICLLADEIGEVADVDTSTYESQPDTLTGVAAELTDGVYRINRQLLLVLNPNKVINLAFTRRDKQRFFEQRGCSERKIYKPSKTPEILTLTGFLKSQIDD